MRPLVLAFAALALLPALAAAADRTTPLAVGDRVPDVTLVDHQGQPFRLADALARHRFVVLAFYVQAFTGG